MVMDRAKYISLESRTGHVIEAQPARKSDVRFNGPR